MEKQSLAGEEFAQKMLAEEKSLMEEKKRQSEMDEKMAMELQKEEMQRVTGLFNVYWFGIQFRTAIVAALKFVPFQP